MYTINIMRSVDSWKQAFKHYSITVSANRKCWTWKIFTVQYSTVHGRYLQDSTVHGRYLQYRPVQYMEDIYNIVHGRYLQCCTVQYIEDTYSTVKYGTWKIFSLKYNTVHVRYYALMLSSYSTVVKERRSFKKFYLKYLHWIKMKWIVN